MVMAVVPAEEAVTAVEAVADVLAANVARSN